MTGPSTYRAARPGGEGDAATVAAILEGLLRDPRVGWSLGRPGAIAEFYWDPEERITSSDLAISTARGALYIAPLADGVRLFAGENLSHAGRGWSHWLSVCLPESVSRMRARSTITELAPDAGALEPEPREAVTFDLGIGGPYFQLGVRTQSPALIQELRAAAGQALLSAGGVVRSLVAASPTRVFESKLARIEVLQPIATDGGQSPEGPHTHFLPHLLQADDAETDNAPHGWTAQLVAYPSHPLRDVHGRKKAFDREAYEIFERWLDQFGDHDHLRIKRAVMHAVRSGASPDALHADADRSDSIRIALRQLRELDGESATWMRWTDAYDPLEGEN